MNDTLRRRSNNNLEMEQHSADKEVTAVITKLPNDDVQRDEIISSEKRNVILVQEIERLRFNLKSTEEKLSLEKSNFRRSLACLATNLNTFEEGLRVEQQSITIALSRKDQEIRVRDDMIRTLQGELAASRRCVECLAREVSDHGIVIDRVDIQPHHGLVSDRHSSSSTIQGLSLDLSSHPSKPPPQRKYSPYGHQHLRSNLPDLSPVVEEAESGVVDIQHYERLKERLTLACDGVDGPTTSTDQNTGEKDEDPLDDTTLPLGNDDDDDNFVETQTVDASVNKEIDKVIDSDHQGNTYHDYEDINSSREPCPFDPSELTKPQLNKCDPENDAPALPNKNMGGVTDEPSVASSTSDPVDAATGASTTENSVSADDPQNITNCADTAVDNHDVVSDLRQPPQRGDAVDSNLASAFSFVRKEDIDSSGGLETKNALEFLSVSSVEDQPLVVNGDAGQVTIPTKLSNGEANDGSDCPTTINELLCTVDQDKDCNKTNGLQTNTSDQASVNRVSIDDESGSDPDSISADVKLSEVQRHDVDNANFDGVPLNGSDPLDSAAALMQFSVEFENIDSPQAPKEGEKGFDDYDVIELEEGPSSSSTNGPKSKQKSAKKKKNKAKRKSKGKK